MDGCGLLLLSCAGQQSGLPPSRAYNTDNTTRMIATARLEKLVIALLHAKKKKKVYGAYDEAATTLDGC